MDSRQTMNDVALVGVFAALIAAFSLTVINIPGNPVPITLQTLAVALVGLVLGPWRGAAAAALYVLVGLAGLPVFAGGASGVGVLAKGSAGYLLSFPLSALLVGFLARRALRHVGRDAKAAVALFGCALAGSIVFVHPLGILGLIRNAHLSMGKAFAMDMTFWPGDLVKCALAAILAVTVHKAFPGLLEPNRRRTVA